MVSLYVYAFGGGLVSVIGSFIWFGVPWWYYLLLALAVIGEKQQILEKNALLCGLRTSVRDWFSNHKMRFSTFLKQSNPPQYRMYVREKELAKKNLSPLDP